MMAKPATRGRRATRDTRDTVKFNEVYLHPGFRFAKGEVVQFGDPDCAGFFARTPSADFCDEGASRTVSEDELNFDPDAPGETIDRDTIFGSGDKAGQKVMDQEL